MAGFTEIAGNFFFFFGLVGRKNFGNGLSCGENFLFLAWVLVA
jgi:hypothetical protein